jgi:hypothetical protein
VHEEGRGARVNIDGTVTTPVAEYRTWGFVSVECDGHAVSEARCAAIDQLPPFPVLPTPGPDS